MVPEEETPLAVVGDGGRVEVHVGDGTAIGAVHRHEHPRHQREVERHVELVAVAEVLARVLGPLVRLREQDAVAVARVDLRPQLLEEGVRLGQVLAARPVALEQVGHGVAPEAVQPLVEPEAERVEHGPLDLGIVVVEIGLVAEEPMPVVRVGDRVPGPVRLLRVHEDDAGVPVLLVVGAPDVPVALRRARVPAGFLEPRVLVRRVVDHEVGHDPDAPAVGFAEKRLEVRHRAVAGGDVVVVGDVVAVVAERRRVERQQPQAVHAQVLDVVEPLRQAAEVPDAVAVAVLERLDVKLVEDGVLVPELAHGLVVRRISSVAAQGQ